MACDKIPFGEHKRAFLYQGVPDYENIVSLEASGDKIERLPMIRDEHGQMLVMGKTSHPVVLKLVTAEMITVSIVSASDMLRDRLRDIVREYLHRRVKMTELEFQP